MKTRYLLPLLLLPFLSCKKDGPGIQPIDIQVNLSYASQELNSQLDLSDVELKLTSEASGNTTTFKPTNGVVVLSGISPGKYDIVASVTISQADYNAATGNDSPDDVTFNASLKGQVLDHSSTIELQLMAGIVGDFVIKQIYYAGSHNVDGALFRDQFVEIYNNTDRTLYADSLYIARAWGKQDPEPSSKHYQPNGQLDWSKSVGMTMGAEANTDYVYLRDLFMIPGTGKTYPVEPGKSIVIAQNALNHKVPFTNNSGKEVSVKNPDLTVDLSKANFEVYYGDIPGHKLFATDINNADVPNMDVISYTGNDWILDNLGRDSYVIFKKSNRAEVTALKSYNEPLLATPSSTAKKYIQLPNDWVMDGVEAQPTLASDRIPKKLAASLDAGYTFVTAGSYSSQAVVRKTDKTVNGVRRLKDTNNSTEDFVVIKANPWGFAN